MGTGLSVRTAPPGARDAYGRDGRPHGAGRRAGAVLLAVTLMTIGCSSKKPPAPPPPPQVGYVQLAAAPVTITAELAGRTVATAIADVRPQVDGVLTAQLFREGALVHRGQALYQVDPAPYIAARDQAAGLLANARAALVADRLFAERNQKLGPLNVAQQTIDNAVATAGQAEATVRQEEGALKAAEINLAWTTVRAPLTGRIGRSLANEGDLVSASQANALSTIAALDPIYVDVTQSSDALLDLRRALAHGHVMPASTRVRLRFTDGTEYPRDGVLEFGEVTVDENSNTVTLRARFPNPQGLLLPGMFVRLVTPQALKPQGILAPQQGVQRTPTGAATALVIGPDGRIARRELGLGPAIGATWLVTSGLSAGDRLVVEGTDKVKPGQTVRSFPVTLPKME